ncbi:hypothetical protein HKX48_001392 [Thoreauomyces humboldtii]|nr:hypothetical protein HKX48_001392 [Thoreauomyces humboldtii]
MLPLLLPTLLALLATVVHSYPEGAGICAADASSIAAVGAMGAQNPALPFTLTVPGNVTTFSAAAPVTLTLNGAGTYSGLLMYGAATVDATSHAGNFSGFDPTMFQTLDTATTTGVANCATYGLASTLSHTSSTPKTLPQNFTWTPPSGPGTGTVNFFAAVVVSGVTGFNIVQLASPLTGA